MSGTPEANDRHPAPFCALGLDVGGSKIAAGVVIFPEGKVRFRRVIPTLPSRGGEAVLADTVRLGQELVAEARGERLGVQGIGIGVCELVDTAGRVVSANCLEWRGLPVLQRFALLAPTVIEADVRAAALAEALLGAGQSSNCFLYVTVGTGISSCLVLEGRPFMGARGATGTIASSPLPKTSETGEEAAVPSLEEIASGPALVERYHRRARGIRKSAQEVILAAAAGDPDAVHVVHSAGETLGSIIGWLVNLLDPEKVVVGGGLGLSGGLYWASLIASTRRHIWSDLHRELPILPAGNGVDTGLIGAAATAWKRLA